MPLVAPLPMHTIQASAQQPLMVRAVAIDRQHLERQTEAHLHDFYELMLFTAGSGHHQIGEQVLAVSPGDLFLIAPGERHDVRGLQGGVRGWVVIFHADTLAANNYTGQLNLPLAYLGSGSSLPGELLLLPFLATDPLGNALHFQLDDRLPNWLARIEALSAEMTAQQIGSELAVQAHLHLLLIDLARLVAPRLSTLSVAARPLLERVFSLDLLRKSCAKVGDGWHAKISSGPEAESHEFSPSHWCVP
ncbi:AraC family ligand binding domain-containing protein [Deinococcus marmoris]|nr:AraC family ligand binding domain-containing protein [Deinococcus marmoris]